MESRSPSPPSLSPTPHPAQLHHPPQPQSKRDKRRTALSEKLTTLTNAFHSPSNPRLRDQHYRAQLASLQADMQLIARADVSGQDLNLKDDSPEAIQREIDTIFAATGAQREFMAEQGMVGRWYSQFLEDVNDAMEGRDTQLVLLHQQHQAKARSVALQHTRSLVHAREEHRSLAQTIQARVSTRLKSQLKKLAAEKESSSASANALSSLSAGVFDIAETNALLLHPSQFGAAAGIGSPRRHGNRDLYDDDTEKEMSTRRKNRRRGEVEELMGFGASINFDPPSSNGKRKRRGGGRDEDEASTPAAMDAASPSISQTVDHLPLSSSIEDRKRLREEMLKQVYTPTYSLEKLFNEKELQHHSNTATLATIRYFAERAGDPQTNDSGDSNDTPVTGANTPVPPVPDDSNNNDDDNSPARGMSPVDSIIRSLAPLPGVNTRSNPPRQFNREIDSLGAVGVPNVGMTFVNKAGIAPPPPPLRSEDADGDLNAIRSAMSGKRVGDGSGAGGKKQRSR